MHISPLSLFQALWNNSSCQTYLNFIPPTGFSTEDNLECCNIHTENTFCCLPLAGQRNVLVYTDSYYVNDLINIININKAIWSLQNYWCPLEKKSSSGKNLKGILRGWYTELLNGTAEGWLSSIVSAASKSSKLFIFREIYIREKIKGFILSIKIVRLQIIKPTWVPE